MAVQDKYVNSDVAAGNRSQGAAGSQAWPLFVTFETLAADDDGSKYRLFKGLAADLIPVSMTIMCDAITAGTDYDVGFYKPDLGAVIDKDNLADGLDLSSASKVLDGLKDVAIENRGKRLFELAGHTQAQRLPAYDIVLTANTVGSAAGTISAILWVKQG